ncbi:hypothetical protein [Agrobacterium cavarae]|uniref:hypothetical protein n=1 Tax=Agrobacterium cavarae TaxID=2528239 RepID=UPI003FD5E943
MGALQTLDPASLDASDLRRLTGSVSNSLFNVTPSSTRRLKSKFGAFLNGDISNLRILCTGDSNKLGYGAGEGGTAENAAYRHSVPYHMANRLRARGYEAFCEGRFGDGARAANAAIFDTRINLGSGWSAPVNGATVIGTNCFENNSTTNDLTITPSRPVKKWRLWYLQQSGLGAFGVKIGAGATTSVDSNGSSVFQSVLLTATSASLDPLIVTRVSGNCRIAGWEAWDDTNGCISVSNGASFGSKASNWAVSGQYRYPPVALPVIAPHINIHDIGINDVDVTDILTWTAQMQVWITAALQNDAALILKTMNPVSTAAASQSGQDAIRVATYGLAISNDVPLFDAIDRHESYAVQNALGRTYDTKHFKGGFYADNGKTLADLILSA